MNVRVLAGILALALSLAGAVRAQSVSGTGLVRHAPALNGNGLVDGSLQQMLGESLTVNGGFVMTGDLRVPGTPTVRLNGNPVYAGTQDGAGSTSPSNYQITLNGNVRLSHVVRRTNAVALPTVTAPPLPAGTRTVMINSSGQSPGSFSTLRNLTLNGNVGQFAIPPGTYGDFTANGGSGFTLGVAGATQPSVYNFQRLTLNGQTQVQVLGPIVINLAYGFSANGTLGSTNNPAWLTLNVYSGGFTLNGGCTVHGFVNAPNGTVIVNGNSQLIGGVTCDQLIVNGGGVLRLANPASVNHAPVANNSAANVLEDTPTAIALSATDSDGNSLSYSVVTNPTNGTLSGTGASRTYTPAANYFGPDSFTFKVNDGQADSNTATVSITVVTQNDRPVAAPKTLVLNEDSSGNVVLSGTDADGDALTFAVAASPSHGSLSGTAPNLTYTPFANYYGPDSFTYTASDSSQASVAATVSITVNPINDAPVANPQNLSVSETGTLAITLTATDVDDTALSYTVTVSPTRGGLSGTAPNLTYTPFPNAGATDTLTFRVADPSGATSTAVVSIQINNVNDAPVAHNQSRTTPEDIPLSFALTGSDPDGDAITFHIVAQPTHGVLSGTAPNVTYTPEANYFGPDSFTFKTRDTSGAESATNGTVSLSVTSVNDKPLATNQAVALDEDTSLGVVLAGTDIENSALTFTVLTQPQHGTLSTLNGASVTYTPAANYHGADSFTFKVNDGTDDSTGPGTVSITVRPVNDAPAATPQTLAAVEDTPLDLLLAGTDVENSALTFVIDSPPTHGVFSGTLPNLTYTPDANYNGPDSFTFKSYDGELYSTPALVSINVAGRNDPPVATAGPPLVGPQDVKIDFTLNAIDADGDALSYAITTQPLHGTLSGTAPNLSYTPHFNYRGDDFLVFTASDQTTTSNPATINFTLTPISHAPVANGQDITLDEDTPTPIALVATDLDGDALTYTIVTPPTKGTFTGTLPNVTFVPTANVHGPDSFTFRASDNTLESNLATVTLTINPRNDPPLAISAPLAVTEDTPVNFALAATDADGDPLSYGIVTHPTKGVLSGTAPNLTFTPYANATGDDSFTFRATDSVGAVSNLATISIAIAAMNDAPVAVPQTLVTNEDTPLPIPLAATDVDGNPLTFAIVTPPQHGSFTGTAPNLTYTPFANYSGDDSFVFRATDSVGAPSNLATVSLTVNPVNDAPVVTGQSVITAYNTPITLTLTGTDVDSATLTFLVVAAPANGTLGPITVASPTSATVVYTPAANFNGADSFTFKARDGAPLDSNLASVAITVRQPNRVPVATPQNVLATPDTPLPLTLVATDADGDALTFTVVDSPRHGTLSGTAPNLIYTPAAGYAGFDLFTFKASDATTSSAPASVAIIVSAPAPCASSIAILPNGGNATFTSLAGTATLVGWDEYTQVSFPPKKYRKQTANQFYWHLNSDMRGGCISFPYGSTRIEANATSTYSATTGVLTTVGARRYGGYVVHGGSLEDLYQGGLTTSDSSHYADFSKTDVITAQIGFNPPVLTPTSAIKTPLVECFITGGQNHRFLGGDVRWNLSEEDTETDARARATTTAGASNTAFRTTRGTGFSFSFSEVNYTATFNVTTAGTYYVYWTYALKPHGQAGPVTTQTIVQSRTLSTGSHTIAGAVEAILPDVDYTLTSVELRPPCQPPTAHNQSVFVARNTATPVTLTATDPDNEPLTFTIVTPPAHGQVTISGAVATYTPVTGYVGSDSFTFKASDGGSDSAPATVSLIVHPPNTPPRIVSTPTRFHLMRRAYESFEHADVSTWLQHTFVGPDGAPTWTIHPDKRGATQEINSEGTALISDIYVQDSTIEGHFSVGTAFDDDNIGFIFGLQDLQHFYLFDWKQADQGEGLVGMSVKVISANSPVTGAEIYNTAGNGSRVRTIFHNAIPYDDFTDYRFVLTHRPGSIHIVIHRGATVVADINLTDATYAGGKFGFYCLSQEKSHFRDTSYLKHITGDYLYQAQAVDDEGDVVAFSLQQGPPGLTIDGATGLVRWPANLIAAGSHPISIRATDPIGMFAAQDYTLVVEADNLAPRVNAGFDRSIRTTASSLTLLGQVTDDGLPAGNPLAIQWTQIAGPGTLTFATPTAEISAVTATAPGTYLVELSANDGGKRAADLAEVRVAVAAAKAPTDIAAWWPLNGHPQEMVHGNHDFGLFSGAAYHTGKVTQGVRFDGVDDFATVSPHSELDIGASAAGFTIEMWVNPSTVKYAPLINWHNGQTSNGNGLHLWSNNDTNRLSAYLVGTGGTGPAVVSTEANTLVANTWQHIALTYDKPTGVLRLYKDGFIAGSANIGPNYRAQTTFPIFFGRNPQDLPAYEGALDEVTFYNRALSTAEIRAQVAAGADGKSPFDQNTPPVVDAGPDFALPPGTTTISLDGTVTDDTRPFGVAPTSLWSQVSGPSVATFANDTAQDTTATITAPGTYVFRLTGSDGFLAPVSDLVEVRVGVGAAEPPQGLVAWWTGNGHMRDSVSGAHELDLLHGASFTPAKVADGFRFDGVNDHAFVDRYPELDIGASATGFTMEMWVRPETVTYGPLLHWHNGATDGPHLWTNTDGRVAAYFVGAGGEVINALGVVEANVWTHVALTWTKATGAVRIYKNGSLAGSGFVSTSYRPRTDFDLGAAGVSHYTQRFHGTLDEIALYNRPLAPAELLAIYEAGADGKSPPDNNTAPFVTAGRDIVLASPGTATLNGIVNDDNLPFGAPTALWSVVGDPSGVSFGNAAAASTTVSFTAPGTYILKLTGSDGYSAPVSDLLEVRVGVSTIPPPADLAAWWPGNGHAREVVRGGHDIELYNGAGLAAGRIAQGFNFDGVNDYGVVRAHPDFDIGASSAGFSIELWIKPDVVTYGPLLDWHNGTTYGVEFWTNSDGRITGYLAGSNGGGVVDAPTAGITAGVWQHVVLTFDKSTGVASLYKNGAVVGSGNVGTGYRARTDYDLYFGRNPKDPQTFDGTLDEISLYTRPLSASEITAIYNATGGKTPIVINTAPVVIAGADRTAYTHSPITLAGSASDDGEPATPGALTYLWSKVSGPGGATFSTPTSPATNATFDAPGTYTVRLSASDSLLTGTDDLIVTVTTPASQPPVVALVQPRVGAVFPASLAVDLIATATDPDGTIAGVEFFRGTTSLGFGTPVSGRPHTYRVTTTFTTVQSPVSITARATDNSGVVVTSAAVSAAVVANPPDPDVDLISPAADARIAAPSIVRGAIVGDTVGSWALEYRLKAAEGASGEAWISLGTGYGPAGSAGTPADFGVFDPTRLINGIYELRLSATDMAGVTTSDAPRTVLVEGNMKIGAFSIAFEDLKVPVAGIPITINRSYDSRDTRVGDFGPGWRLSLANVRVQKNRNLGLNWHQTELPPGANSALFLYYVEPVQARIVTVTMPDGETLRFRAGVYVKNTPPESGYPDNASLSAPATQGKYRFYPIGDTTAKLEPLNASNQLAEDFFIGVSGSRTGFQDLTFEDRNANPFAPAYNTTRFRLTLNDGTVMLLDEALGLLESRDLDGNTLVVNRDAQNRVNGVTATQNAPGGAIVRTVAVHRDANGRVDYIRDLANKTLDYLYDAQGRLASFTDRESNITQYRYESAAFPLYLTKIVDPRGISALRTEYDPATGRMIKQIDADGKETIFNHGAGVDAASRFEKVKDRLGNETTFFYDERGNVTVKIEPVDPATGIAPQTTYSYWPDGDRVKFETDHYGNVKSSAYDERGNPTVQTIGASASEDPANPTTGYITRTTYNTFSAPTQITDPDGRVQTFTYDPTTNGLLTHTIGVGGSAPATTTYTYKSDGELDTITDAAGNVTSHVYDYAFTSATYPGAVKQLTVTITDPAGAAGSDPANASATMLRITRTLFDAQENQLAQIVPRTLPDGTSEDVVTRYLYDAENRLKATILPDGRVSETRYTSFGKEEKVALWKTFADYTTHVDSNARITTYGYDARGNLTSTTHADGATELVSFDLENRKAWAQDRRGYRTFFTYDAAGRLRVTIHPEASDGTDAAAPTEATDPRLATNPRSEIQYDLVGRVRFQIDERGAKTEFVYEDGCGCAMRRKQMIQHRAAGNLVTHYEYDKAGNVRYVTDPRGNTTETRYDEHGRSRLVVYPATDEHPATQAETRYDVLGRRIAAIDPEGRITRYRYDGLGRLVEVRQYIDAALAASDANFSLAPSTANLAVTRYGYDTLGYQQTQLDALGRVTTYWTDRLGRRTQRLLPKETTESAFLTENLQYDEWGNLWKRTDFAGKTTTFGYDTLNRLKSKTADATHPSLTHTHAIARIEFDYDAAGGRTATRTYNASNTSLYSESTPRDERGRIDYKDIAGGRLDYSYHANNLLKDVVSSNSGGVNLGYRYDELNRVEFVDDSSTGLPTRTTGYTYNANGSLETVTTPNGVTHTYGYDAVNRLRSLTVTRGATTLHSYDYRLRASGHRRQVVENAARTTDYGYDALYRLTGETIAVDSNGNNGAIGYDLDKVGNRQNRNSSVPSVPSVLSRTYNARDWLDGDTYTANGSTQVGQLSSPALGGTDTYDFEERLILRTKSDGTTIKLSYDADGHRIQKTVTPGAGPVTTTDWLVDTNNLTGYCQVFEERIASGSTTTLRTYSYGATLLSQAVSVNSGAATLSYYTHDGHGNVRELTNASGTVTDRYDYDAFGLVIYRSGSTSNAYLYCGEQFDADLGLYYNRARYLNTDSGRFWSMDAWQGRRAEPITLHKFIYADAEPVSGSDPSGLETLVGIQGASGVQGRLQKLGIPNVRAVGKKVVKKLVCITARGATRNGPLHHIATNKNYKAGGQFSKKFDEVFEQAGIDLNHWANKLKVPGHRGPHPEKYHEEVLEFLRNAVESAGGGAGGVAAEVAQEVLQEALEDALFKLASRLCKDDDPLTQLIVPR